MDLRSLIKLIPFAAARDALHGLLDRFEALERRMDELEGKRGS